MHRRCRRRRQSRRVPPTTIRRSRVHWRQVISLAISNIVFVFLIVLCINWRFDSPLVFLIALLFVACRESMHAVGGAARSAQHGAASHRSVSLFRQHNIPFLMIDVGCFVVDVRLNLPTSGAQLPTSAPNSLRSSTTSFAAAAAANNSQPSQRDDQLLLSSLSSSSSASTSTISTTTTTSSFTATPSSTTSSTSSSTSSPDDDVVGQLRRQLAQTQAELARAEAAIADVRVVVRRVLLIVIVFCFVFVVACHFVIE